MKFPESCQAINMKQSKESDLIEVNTVGVQEQIFLKSERLAGLNYEIRGATYERALQLQREGIKIIPLNIGNPAAFGFETPDEIVADIISNIRDAQGYIDSRGLFAARKAVMHYYQSIGVLKSTIEDIFIGNGVSELIMLCMQALLNPGDEVLVPAPDYPLWTTAVELCGGKTVHYVCDEQSDWQPDLVDLEKKISSRTKGIVLINPNNPTGAVYSTETVEHIVTLAEKHKIILFADEIYDKILYDGAKHQSVAPLVRDTLAITFGGLSKNYRAAGFRGGWMILTGAKARAKSYVEGLTLLASLRLCANVITQYGIQTALGGYQSINSLVEPSGRLYKQMDFCHKKLLEIPYMHCVRPKGAMYVFPHYEADKFMFKSDEAMVHQLLEEEHILMVNGSGFNIQQKNYFRIVFLPNVDTLSFAMGRIHHFFERNLK